MSVNKEDLKFQIDQLRKDKIIYGVEATAFSLASLIFINYSYSVLQLPKGLANSLNLIAFLFAIGYTFNAGFGNLKRLRKIEELEKKLQK